MDARIVAERKGLAIARIESVLDVLINQHGMSSSFAGVLRKNYAEPNLTDLYRIEGIAEFMENLLLLVMERAGKARLSSKKNLQPGEASAARDGGFDGR